MFCRHEKIHDSTVQYAAMRMPNYFSSPRRLLKRVASPRATEEHEAPSAIPSPRWLRNVRNFQTRAVQKIKPVSYKILILQSRWRFAAGVNLPLLGLLGSLSRPLEQDEWQRARSSWRPASQLQSPSKPLRIQDFGLSFTTSQQHTYNQTGQGPGKWYPHSFVKSQSSRGARRPCYLSHPQHTTYV